MLEDDTEPETTNVQPDSQCSSASEEILFHGKSAKSRKTARESREYIDDSDSSADLNLLEEMVNQLSDAETDDNEDTSAPPKSTIMFNQPLTKSYRTPYSLFGTHQ